MQPILLQNEPVEILRFLQEMFPFILFIAVFLLPVLRNVRERMREAQRRQQRSAGDPQAGESTAGSAKQQVSQEQLEERVRRYFEQLSGGRTEPPPARKPAPSESPRFGMSEATEPPAQKPHGQVVDVVEPKVKFLDPHVDLHRVTSRPAFIAGYVDRLDENAGRRRRAGILSATRLGRDVRNELRHGGQSVKRAILLREILGPPKALE